MLINFDQVTKKYRPGNFALNSASFSIDAGEFVFLVGPSGAGKTTILRLLIRDLIPDSGNISVDGHKLEDKSKLSTPQLRRHFGMIFQDFKILSDRTVFENISLSLEIAGHSKDEIAHKVKEVMQLVNLHDNRDLFPVQLSAGELQRIAIARAIVAGPKILLADEPTGNLDPTTAWEIIKVLKEINRLGTTVIMATHNADIVNSLKQRVISLKSGKIVKDQKKSKYF